MKKLIGVVALVLGCFGIGFLIGKGLIVLSGKGFAEVDNAKMAFAVGVSLVSLIVGFLANTILHELGHMIGGLLTGYRFLSFRIFKYTIVKDCNGLHWKLFSINGTAGQCLMIPPTVEDEKQLPYFWYNAGGVLANLLLVILCAVLIGAFDLSVIPFSLCMMLLVTGLYMLVMNAIPMDPGGTPNDGKNLLVLWKHPEQRGCFYRMMSVVAEQSFGKRLSEMPETYFVDVPLPTVPTVMQLADRNLFQCWLYDSLRFDEAREVAEEIMNVENLPQLYRMETASDCLFLELATLNRAEVVTKLWDKKLEQYVRQTAKYMPTKLVTLFAYELINNQNPEEAQKYYDEVERRMYKYSQPGEARTAIAIMDFLKEHHASC